MTEMVKVMAEVTAETAVTRMAAAWHAAATASYSRRTHPEGHNDRQCDECFVQHLLCLPEIGDVRGKRLRRMNGQNKYVMPTTRMVPVARNNISGASLIIRANMGTFLQCPDIPQIIFHDSGCTGQGSARQNCVYLWLYSATAGVVT
jgi:hypothetical protein